MKYPCLCVCVRIEGQPEGRNADEAIVDLNLRHGEGYGQWTLGAVPDEEIMPLISSANIAAGFMQTT